MDFSPALTDDLGVLTEALDDQGTDLLAVLDVLADDVSAVIPSFLGLTVRLLLDGNPLTLTAVDERWTFSARASLKLPLAALTAAVGGTVVLYAANPGAFVDLAADSQRIFGLDGQVVIDGHLPSPADPIRPAGITGLRDLSVINRAIGVLIELGHTPSEAHAELRRRAADDQLAVPSAAERMLAAIERPHRADCRDLG